jgi:hypothetical protein
MLVISQKCFYFLLQGSYLFIQTKSGQQNRDPLSPRLAQTKITGIMKEPVPLERNDMDAFGT